MNRFSTLPTAHQPVVLLQKLIQFDTINPPGNERECVMFIRDLLADAGIESQIFAKSAGRPNLLARLSGQGKSAPLLLHGHVDVVTTENQAWAHPPFEGKLVDGFVWGRGALDMKGGVAMLLAAFLAAKRQEITLPGDIILAIVCDEEAGSDFGARFLVENHPEQFSGIRYALGEFGGFTLTIGKKRFYPIQIAEKQACWLKATVRGIGGHASIPVRTGSMYKLGLLLSALSNKRLPVHITPVARRMFSAMASNLGGLNGLLVGQLLNPMLTNKLLDLMGERGRAFDPLLHHTVSPTVLHGSSKINVIPGEVSVELDGRLLPECRLEEMLDEIRQISPPGVELEVLRYDPGPTHLDLGLFDTLAETLKEMDANGIPVPLLLSGITDGRFFSRLGIQTYGFLPMQLPDDFNFSSLLHAGDERIPAAAVEFGTNAIFKTLQRF